MFSQTNRYEEKPATKSIPDSRMLLLTHYTSRQTTINNNLQIKRTANENTKHPG